MDEDIKRKLLNAIERKRLSQNISESRLNYKESMTERMLPKLEQELRERKTSLGDHPCFPSDDESHFEEKIMAKRFEEVVNRVKKNFDMEKVNNSYLVRNMSGMVDECMQIESKHRKELEKLAEQMIRDEYDMSSDDVDIIVELTDNINMEGTKKNPSPIIIDEMEFDNHNSIDTANDEVYKRRFINAMIQGSAKKSSHMFNMKEEELTSMNPLLFNNYGRLMSAADYMYYITHNLDGSTNGGVVRVTFPQNEGEKPVIHAQAMVFPVLIHELVKGVMELLSSHGLPQDDKLKKYVIGKADFLNAEPWDMRIGPGIWQKFTESINPEDFKLKHHVYSELVSLPVREFNSTMKEIMAGTKKGKDIVSKIVQEVKDDFKRDEFNESMESRRNSYKDTIENPDELDDIDLSGFGL